MMQRSPIVEATQMSGCAQPIVTALSGLQRSLFDPSYVSDLRMANGIRAKTVAWRLGDRVHSGLIVDYLSGAIKIEKGRDWSRMFGNFMATASAFRAMLNTTELDEQGFVTELGTHAIKDLFMALMKHRKIVNELAGRDVSKTMQVSAAYCSRLVDDLHELYFTSGHWATIDSDGTIHIPTIDKKALADPGSKGLPVVGGPEESALVITASGLDAFKAWAGRASEPNNFLESIVIPAVTRVGEQHTSVRIDPYGKTGGLPAPHPSFASPVYRVLVELMAIAESSRMPELRFRANGWRNGAYEAQVPTQYTQ